MRKVLLCLALSLPLFSQNAAMLPDPHIRFTDASGRPLSLGKIYTCVAGTSCPGNPLATYTDSTAVTQNANPIILDAGGYASVWIGTGSYKLVAQNALGVQQWTQDNVSSTAIAVSSLKCAANGYACLDGSSLVPLAELPLGVASGPAKLDANSFVLQAELNYTQGGTGAVNRTVQSKLKDTVSVKDFGAKGDNTADDTAAINAAIAAVSATGGAGTVIFPAGTYKISSTITLPNAISLIAFDNSGSGNGHTTIIGNFAGFLLEINATSGNIIQGLALNNQNWSGTLGTSGCIRTDGINALGMLRDDYLYFKDTGLLGNGGQLISWVIENTFFSGDSGSTNQSYCIHAYGRNSRILGGRAYGCNVAYGLSGDDWHLDNVDAEFNNIDIQQGPIAGMLIENSHFETSGMLWTNANTLPTTTTYPWTDNGGTGTGWSGTTRFINNNIFFNPHTSPNGQGAPLFVLKSGSGMTGRIVLDGNIYALGAGTPANFKTISASFDYTQAAALVSGVGVVSWDYNINIPTIPVDQYTFWMDLSSGYNYLGGYLSAGALKINGLAMTAPLTGQVTLGGSALAAGACTSGVATLNGGGLAYTAAAIVSGYFYSVPPNFPVQAQVSGPNQVTVSVCAIAAGTPPSETYNVRVLQ